MRQDPAGAESMLLLHWGHGIGAAFSTGGEVVNRHRGRFCEIGHWGLGNGQGRRCRCGNADCLETVAALWALRPALAETMPGLPLGESELAGSLRTLDLERVPVLVTALAEVLRLTANLCRLFFPDRIVLTGPFVQNPEIFSRFVQTLAHAPLLRSLDKVSVAASTGGLEFEIAGALRDPFGIALRNLIRRGKGPLASDPAL